MRNDALQGQEHVSAGRGAAPVTPLFLDSTRGMVAPPGVYDFGGFTFYDTEGLTHTPKQEWMIPGILPARSLAFAYGPSRAGKTFFTLDMSLSLSAGRRFLGRDVEPAPVAYLYLEGADTAQDRATAWRIAHHGGAHVRNCVFTPTRIDLMDEGERYKLLGGFHSAGFRPRLLVVDTLAVLSGGRFDIMQSRDMQRLIAVMGDMRDALGATVLVVAHPPKGNAETIAGVGDTFNGADTVLRLTRSTKRGGDVGGTVLVEKQRGGVEGETIRYMSRLVDTGDGRAVPVLTYPGIEDAPATRKASGVDTLPLHLQQTRDIVREIGRADRAAIATRRGLSTKQIGRHLDALDRHGLLDDVQDAA